MATPSAESNPFRESESWFRALADSAPVLIWSSGRDGLCTYFNKRWLRFTGRTLEQSLGDGWVKDVHPEDRKRILSEYQQAFERRDHFRLEYRLRRQRGGYEWIVDFGSPVFRPDGSFLGYTGSCVDIAAVRNSGVKTNWLQKYVAAFAGANASELPLRVEAAEVAIRERLEQNPGSDEQRTLRRKLARLLALKKDKLGFAA